VIDAATPTHIPRNSISIISNAITLLPIKIAKVARSKVMKKNGKEKDDTLKESIAKNYFAEEWLGLSFFSPLLLLVSA
ncbi:MAG: hypothetical protein UHY58_07190, partial [Alistipes sp.]|nr:hypothetical protein [Alistipes sp.]